MEKGIKNVDTIARNFGLALTKTTNHWLKVVRKKGRKKEEMVEKQRTEVIAAKYQRVRGVISLSGEEEENYESETENERDPNEANDEYLLPNCEIMVGKL